MAIIYILVILAIMGAAFKCCDIMEKLDEEEHKKQEDAKHFTIQF